MVLVDLMSIPGMGGILKGEGSASLKLHVSHPKAKQNQNTRFENPGGGMGGEL